MEILAPLAPPAFGLGHWPDPNQLPPRGSHPYQPQNINDSFTHCLAAAKPYLSLSNLLQQHESDSAVAKLPGEVLLGAEGHPNSLNLQLVALPVLLVQPAGPGMVVVEPLLALLALLAGLQLVVQLAAQPAAQPLAALPAGLVGQLFAELELLALAEQPAVHAP